jgi:hypothetical protein
MSEVKKIYFAQFGLKITDKIPANSNKKILMRTSFDYYSISSSLCPPFLQITIIILDTRYPTAAGVLQCG